jgi:hypothetical protein
VHHERVVVALADHRQVLVLAEAGEIERLAVDQEPVAADRHRAYTDALVIAVYHHPIATVVATVAEELYFEVVEIAVAGCPRVHVGHRQGAGRPAALGDRPAGRIP